MPGVAGAVPRHRRRLRSLGAALAENDLPALLVTDGVNRRYLTGFTGSAGWVVVAPEEAWLLVDGRYEEQAGEEAACPVVGYRERKDLLDSLRGILNRLGAVRVGIEAASLTVAGFDLLREKLEGIELVPTKGLVEGLRAVKDAGEVEAIRRAVGVAEEAWRALAGGLGPGRTEEELALELEYAMRRLGAEAPAFDAIVLVGAATSRPHGRPGRGCVAPGELLLCDFGARVAGYHSDLTRTWVVGEPDRRQEEVHAAVLAAQRAALAAIRPGVTGAQVHQAALGALEEAGLADHFVHGTGHGVGLAIHEAPRLGKDSEDVLRPGMVVTVEPGVYIPGWGGVRVEDMALVTEEGCQVLTSLERGIALRP